MHHAAYGLHRWLMVCSYQSLPQAAKTHVFPRSDQECWCWVFGSRLPDLACFNDFQDRDLHEQGNLTTLCADLTFSTR